MAIQGNFKKAKPVESNEEVVTEIENATIQAMHQVGEDDTPFLKAETDGNLTIMGDPNKIVIPENNKQYTLQFILPKAEFNTEDFEEILRENDQDFLIEVTATQEKITPYNRTYFAMVASEFLLLFFEEYEEGKFRLIETDSKQARRNMHTLYRDDVLLESVKFFVGKFLGVDEELIPYINEVGIPVLVVDLIASNPSIFNEMYFNLK